MKMKKIVAVVIIMFISLIIILGEGSKLVFQKICERRETAWPDLGTADDEQYDISKEFVNKIRGTVSFLRCSNNYTSLRGEQQATISYNRMRCDKY